MNTYEVIKEIKRKSIHVIPGFMAIPFIIWLGKPIAFTTSLFFFTLYALNEISIRKNLGFKVPIAYQTYMIMARKEELENKTFIGTIYFWGLTTIIILLLPPIPAAAAVMVSSLGDAAAAIIGKICPYPRNPLNKRKSLTGSVAMFLISIIVCLIAGLSLYSSLIVAISSTLAEALTKKSVNDELSVPIVSGIVSYLTYICL